MTPEVDTHGLDDLVEGYLDRGMSAEDTAREVAEVIDAMLPLGLLGPVGHTLEAIDGPVILAIVRFIQSCRADPEKRAERTLKRALRRAQRKADREARKKERESGV